MKCVYFIKPIGMDGPIKIGCSHSPNQRLATLETWAPFPLELVATINGDTNLERRFHALLKDAHSHREWFEATPAVVAVMKQVQCGTFDYSQLPPPECVTTNKGAVEKIRASWTDHRRMMAGYCARIRWAQIKSRMVCPHFYTMAADPEKRAEIDAYLADPHAHGETLEAYEARVGRLPWWAATAARKSPTPDTDRRVA